MPAPLQRGRNLVALRTLLVKVDPTPANLTERRAILSLLKRHGSIHTFKRLLDPARFIAIAKDESMAERLLRNCPIRFDYVPQPSHRDGASNSSPEPITFHVNMMPKPDYSHGTRIRQENLSFGQWPEPPVPLFQEHSLPRAVLRRAIPRDMAWKGLTDWESAGQLDDAEGIRTKLVSENDFYDSRLVRQKNKIAFDSLAAAYEEKHGPLPRVERPKDTERDRDRIPESDIPEEPLTPDRASWYSKWDLITHKPPS